MNSSALLGSPLFSGVSEPELGAMLGCFAARTAAFEKGALIYRSGQTVEHIGLVLSGSVIIESDDLWGNRSIIGHAAAGDTFAETYACIAGEPLLVNVAAAERTEVLFLNAAKLMRVCPNSCAHHNAMIKNLLQISSQKALRLSRRILYTSSKTIRGRLMAYLSDCVKQSGSRTVTLPFNRQQLADFLNVDRSAMCSELSKMQREGLIIYEKNRFEVGDGVD